MKKIIISMILLLFMFSLSSCKDEKTATKPAAQAESTLSLEGSGA